MFAVFTGQKIVYYLTKNESKKIKNKYKNELLAKVKFFSNKERSKAYQLAGLDPATKPGSHSEFDEFLKNGAPEKKMVFNSTDRIFAIKDCPNSLFLLTREDRQQYHKLVTKIKKLKFFEPTALKSACEYANCKSSNPLQKKEDFDAFVKEKLAIEETTAVPNGPQPNEEISTHEQNFLDGECDRSHQQRNVLFNCLMQAMDASGNIDDAEKQPKTYLFRGHIGLMASDSVLIKSVSFIANTPCEIPLDGKDDHIWVQCSELDAFKTANVARDDYVEFQAQPYAYQRKDKSWSVSLRNIKDIKVIPKSVKKKASPTNSEPSATLHLENKRDCQLLTFLQNTFCDICPNAKKSKCSQCVCSEKILQTMAMSGASNTFLQEYVLNSNAGYTIKNMVAQVKNTES